jgi:FkbM family methyltransferase
MPSWECGLQLVACPLKSLAMIEQLLVRLIGRRAAWRLGRKLYFEARRDYSDNMETDGEFRLIRDVVDAAKRARPDAGIVIWDVGANLGLWSRQALDAANAKGLKVRLDAFEPIPSTFAMLSEKLAGPANLNLHQMALSDAVGSGKMRNFGAGAGTNALLRDDHGDGEVIEVTINTGDLMASSLNLDHIDLVKVDAEGHDLGVLKGMTDLFANGRIGVVQFEYNHLWLFTSSSLHKVFQLIADWSYDLARVTRDGLEIITCWNPELDRFISCNYALVRRGLGPQLGVKKGGWDESNVHCPE